MRVLEDGGTAFDAAITASSVMMVALPAANGPGGDVAAVLHIAAEDRDVSLTALGRTPLAADRGRYLARDMRAVPETGIASATTPGAIDGWFALHDRLGSLPMARLLEPATRLAADGVTISDQNQRWITDNIEVLEQEAFQSLFAPVAHPGAVGREFRNPALARLFDMVAHSTADGARAAIGRAICAMSDALSGWFAPADFVRATATWSQATGVGHGSHRILTNLAPTQGPILLQHLALADRFPRPGDDAATIHLLSEVVNQSYGWRLRHWGDPATHPVPDPIADRTLTALAHGVDPDRRTPAVCRGAYDEGDTTHFVIADRFGNTASWIQSLGLGFGAGVGVSELGLLLSDRLGRSCPLDHGPNALHAGRTPVNTIFAWSLLGPHGSRWTGGTPGGDGQTQWNMQTLHHLIDGRSLMEALGRPKWTYYPGADKAEAAMDEALWVDEELDEAVIDGLLERGHQVVPRPTVGGATRALTRVGNAWLVLDDGRQEGSTIAV